MARTRKIQMSFNAGIVSPVLDGRLDLLQAQQGVRTMRNLIGVREGGAVRRPGLRFIGSVKGRGLGDVAASSGTVSGGLRTASISISPQIFVQAGTPPTTWSWYWTMEAQETATGVWDWETHGFVSWTGATPPFSAGDVWINTDGNPNSGSLLSRYENSDVLIAYASSARTGTGIWADSQQFYSFLQYYTPGLGFIDSFGPITLSDYINP